MEEKSNKKNNIKIIILFILAFIFIMFLPQLRSYIHIKEYEQVEQEKLNKKQEEETKEQQKNTLSTMICSPSSDNEVDYYLSYNKNGLQKYTKVESYEVEANEQEKLEECEKEQESTETGIEIKCEVNNGTFSKSTTYDFTKMKESYRKDNIFDFTYNDSINKIKTNLENREYTCG